MKAEPTPNRPADIARSLYHAMPVARMELAHRSPWELLVATILSAQCTDQRVNQVTPRIVHTVPHTASHGEGDAD